MNVGVSGCWIDEMGFMGGDCCWGYFVVLLEWDVFLGWWWGGGWCGGLFV